MARVYEPKNLLRSNMKRELMDILACPVCKGDLQLNVSEEKNGDVVSGSLYCQKCDYHYSITESIPNLLPPDLNK